MKPTQTTAGHTPWSAYNSLNGRIFKHWRIEDHAGNLIATTEESVNECEHARLIASAPALLAALEGLDEALCNRAAKYNADGQPIDADICLDLATIATSALSLARGESADVCSHNEMVSSGSKTRAWKCAKCGYVYGQDDATAADPRDAEIARLRSIASRFVEYVDEYVNSDDADLDRIASIADEARAALAGSGVQS